MYEDLDLQPVERNTSSRDLSSRLAPPIPCCAGSHGSSTFSTTDSSATSKSTTQSSYSQSQFRHSEAEIQGITLPSVREDFPSLSLAPECFVGPIQEAVGGSKLHQRLHPLPERGSPSGRNAGYLHPVFEPEHLNKSASDGVMQSLQHRTPPHKRQKSYSDTFNSQDSDAGGVILSTGRSTAKETMQFDNDVDSHSVEFV